MRKDYICGIEDKIDPLKYADGQQVIADFMTEKVLLWVRSPVL